MLELMLISLRVRFTVAANRLINFFKFIKEPTKYSLYGDYFLKSVFMVFGAVFIAIKNISLRFLYAAFLVGLGMALNFVAAHGGYAEFFAAIGDSPAVSDMSDIIITSSGGDRYGQWETENINGVVYRISEHTVTSEGQLINYTVSISGDSLPAGIKTVDSDNIERTVFDADEKFKIIIPDSSLSADAWFGFGITGEFQDYAHLPPPNFPHYILWVWFTLSFAGAIFGASTVGVVAFSGDNENIMINYLRANPALYAKSHILINLVGDILLYLPYLLIGFAIAGFPLVRVLVILLIYAAFRLFGEVINLFMYGHTGKHFGHSPYMYLSVFVLIAALYFPVYFDLPDWELILTNPVIIIPSAIAAVLSWLYINKYNLYAPFWRDRLQYHQKLKSDFTLTGRKAVFIDAKKWSEDLDAEDIKSDSHKNKTGFAYLNAIFFDRHSKFFRKKIFKRIAVIFAPFIVIAFLAALGIIDKIDNINLPLNLASWENALAYAPSFFIIVHFASMGSVVTASLFSNCDIQMLHYTYYRAKKNIFPSFKMRFAAICRYNFIIIAAMACSALTSLRLLFGYIDYIYAGLFCALLLGMGIFFAFNDLFLYYAIQPYDSASVNKSNIYKIVEIAIFIIAVISFELRIDFIGYIILTFALIILYLLIGTILLLYFAPKKFKLR